MILTNGNLHYFWDLERGNPGVITKIPTLESLHHKSSFAPDPSTLVGEMVEEDYIARIQNPLFDKDPRWINEKTRPEYVHESGLKFLRPFIRVLFCVDEYIINQNNHVRAYTHPPSPAVTPAGKKRRTEARYFHGYWLHGDIVRSKFYCVIK